MEQLLPLILKSALLSAGALAVIKLLGLVLSSVIVPTVGIVVAMRLGGAARRFMRAKGEAAIIKAERPEKFVVVVQPPPARQMGDLEAPRVTHSPADSGIAALRNAAAPAVSSVADRSSERQPARDSEQAGRVIFNHRNRLASLHEPSDDALRAVAYGHGRREMRH